MACDQKCRHTKMFKNLDTGKCGYLDLEECYYCIAGNKGSCDKDAKGNDSACLVASGAQKLYTCSNCTGCGAVPVNAKYAQADCTKEMFIDIRSDYTVCQTMP